MIMHNMSSSSDAFRSKKYVDQRKRKLQNQLDESKNQDRMIVRPIIGEIMETRSDGVDEPPVTPEYDIQPMKKPMPLLQKMNRRNRRSWASSNDDENSSNTPGERIQKIFQERAYDNIAPNYAVSSRNRIKTAIEDAQKRVCRDTENENHGTEQTAQETDLRSLYKTYMAGNIKKERVVRMGAEWTAGYRARRRERGKPKKYPTYMGSKLSSSSDDSLASEPSYGQSVASSPAMMQQAVKMPTTKIDEMGFVSFH